MQKRISISLLFLFSWKILSANEIEKGFQALSIYDYFKARAIFYKQLNKYPREAGYGLALIYFRSDNPFHQLDSAGKYIRLSVNRSGLKQNEKNQLSRPYPVNDSMIGSLNDSICLHALNRMIKALSPESAENYLGLYTNSKYKKKILCMRDSLVFGKLKLSVTSSEISEYLRTYPQSCYLREATNMLEFAIYIETTAARNDSAFLGYINKYPMGKYIHFAREELLNYYIATKNPKGIYAFIKRFGSVFPTSYAWNMLLGIEVSEYSKNSLEAFVKKYPDYPLRNEIEEDFKYWQTPLFIIRKNDKSGFCDSTGRILIEANYTEAEDFSEGYSLVQKNDLYGYINKSGRVKIDFQYTDAGSFANHVAVVQKNKAWFLIDHSNKTLSAAYDEIADFSEGLAIVKKGNLFGAINTNGLEVIKPGFESLSDFNEGRASYLKNGKYGFIDKQGFTSIVPLFNWVSVFRNGRCRVQVNKSYGVINDRGDFIIQPSFDLIDEARYGIYPAVKNNLYGFMDSTGCYLTEIKYAYTPSLTSSTLTDGVFLRLVTAKKQYLQNLNGQKFLPDENAEEVSLPYANFVIVKQKARYALYSLAKPGYVKRGMSELSTDGKYWFMKDRKGLQVCDLVTASNLFSLKAEKVISLTGNYLLLETEEGKGLTDLKGNEVLAPVYEDVRSSHLSHIVYVENDGKGAYFNLRTRSFTWKQEGF